MFAVRNQFISGALFCYLKINTNSSLLPSLIIPRGSSCSAGGEFWQGEGEIWNFILFCSGERVNKVFFPSFVWRLKAFRGGVWTFQVWKLAFLYLSQMLLGIDFLVFFGRNWKSNSFDYLMVCFCVCFLSHARCFYGWAHAKPPMPVANWTEPEIIIKQTSFQEIEHQHQNSNRLPCRRNRSVKACVSLILFGPKDTDPGKLRHLESVSCRVANHTREMHEECGKNPFPC